MKDIRNGTIVYIMEIVTSFVISTLVLSAIENKTNAKVKMETETPGKAKCCKLK